MIDPDAYADYETWKAKKIAGQIDISIATYNNEVTALASAWESAMDAAIAAVANAEAAEALHAIPNPYRAKGMTGALPE